MLLQRLVLRDYRIFKDVDLDLSKVTLSCIVGKWVSDVRRSNGSGKSNLLEAIPYALFGTVRGKDKKAVIRRGAKKCLVELTFAVGQRQIIVSRTRGLGLATATVYVDGQLAAAKQKDVDEVIKRYIGVDRELFELIYFFRQGHKQFGFVSASPGERKSYLSSVFQMGRLGACMDQAKSAYKKAVSRQERATGRAEAWRGRVATMVNRDQLVINVLEAAALYSRAVIARDSHAAYVRDIQGDIQEHKVQLAAYSEMQNDVQSKIQDAKHEMTASHNGIGNIEVRLNGNKKLLDEQTALLKSLQVDDVDPDKTEEDWNAEVAKHQEMYDDAQHRYREGKEKIKRAQQMAESASSIEGSECPTCYQKIPSHHVELLVAKAGEEARNEKHLSNLLAVAEKQRTKLDRVQQLRSNATRVSQATNVQQSITRLTRSIDNDTLALRQMRRSTSDIQQRLVLLQGSSGISISKVQQIVNTFCDSDYLKQTDYDIERLATNLAHAEFDLDDYDQVNDNIVQAEKEIAQAAHDVAVYKLLCEAFGKDGIQAIIIDNITSVIEQFANEILHNMQTQFQVELRTQRQTAAGDTKETLDIIVYDNAEESIFEECSGGEQTLINLAIRLALSRIVSTLHGVVVQSLFLDEVLAALDEVNREEVIKVLSYLSKSFEQILVISHTSECKDILSGDIIIERYPKYSKVK